MVRPTSYWYAFVALMALAATASHAQACAVCFGDPNSPMAKGVVAGVFVLLGVIMTVLVGVAGTGLFWVQRNRRLANPTEVDTPRD